MSNDIKRHRIECPHCAHHFVVELDYSNGDQDYFDECPNCCSDVHIKLHLDEALHRLKVIIASDDEQIY